MSELVIWGLAGLAVVAIVMVPRLRARLQASGWRSHRSHRPHRLRRDRSAMVGRRGLVLQQVDGTRGGRIRVSGETWAARCARGQLEPGTRVEVVQVRGGTAHVQAVPDGEAEPA